MNVKELVDHFNHQICKQYKSSLKKFDSGAMKALQNVNWTGNIRELRNVVERLIILGGPTITSRDVEQHVISVNEVSTV